MKAVDLFAGLGGFSEGARMAGVSVVWAANHWREAVDTHAQNHPGTEHACQDLHQADWSRVPSHDILLASPACQGHTRARGKERPHHDVTRSTAWAVVSALEFHRPPLALVENVPEFARWALFPAWCAALHALGYAIAPKVIDAANHRVPQHRRRLFVTLTRSKFPLELRVPLRDHVAASTIIDFNSGNWTPIDRPGRALATLERIRNGRARYGDAFLTAFYGNERGGRALHRPIGTITTRDRWAIVRGDSMRMLSVPEARRAMGFRDDYQLPENNRTAMHMLGNAVCPPLIADILTTIKEAA